MQQQQQGVGRNNQFQVYGRDGGKEQQLVQNGRQGYGGGGGGQQQWNSQTGYPAAGSSQKNTRAAGVLPATAYTEQQPQQRQNNMEYRGRQQPEQQQQQNNMAARQGYGRGGGQQQWNSPTAGYPPFLPDGPGQPPPTHGQPLGHPGAANGGGDTLQQTPRQHAEPWYDYSLRQKICYSYNIGKCQNEDEKLASHSYEDVKLCPKDDRFRHCCYWCRHKGEPDHRHRNSGGACPNSTGRFNKMCASNRRDNAAAAAQ